MTTITVTITEASTAAYTLDEKQALELLGSDAPQDGDLVAALEALDADDLSSRLEGLVVTDVELAVTDRDVDVKASGSDEASGQ